MLLAALAARVTMFALDSEPGDVSNPDVEFETAPPTAPPKSAAQAAAQRVRRRVRMAGLRLHEGAHALPAARRAAAPAVPRALARDRATMLLEFPPVLCRRSLFLLKNNGALYTISRWTGDVRWKRKLGYLAASSPACGHGTRLRGAAASAAAGSSDGRVVALARRDRRTRWSRALPSRAESSPLLDRGTLYFGSENGTVYALRASDGFVRWTYKAAGAVKGALALDSGRLFFGDYGGHVYALRAADGHQLWQRGAPSGGAFGLGSGNFYSTPSVAYGRVYIGTTNGSVYSFAARNGKLAWRNKTGGYVYASPAVGAAPAAGRRSGSAPTTAPSTRSTPGPAACAGRATRAARSPAAPTVIGDLVFYSTSAEDDRRRSAPPTARMCGRSARRVQPGRSATAAADLLRRLRVAVRARAGGRTIRKTPAGASRRRRASSRRPQAHLRRPSTKPHATARRGAPPAVPPPRSWRPPRATVAVIRYTHSPLPPARAGRQALAAHGDARGGEVTRAPRRSCSSP